MQITNSDKLVVKRNGRVVNWDSFRIQHAIFRAAYYGKYKTNPIQANMLANNVAKIVETRIAQLQFDKIEIDLIQNAVIKALKETDPEVAQDFFSYKTQQDIERTKV